MENKTDADQGQDGVQIAGRSNLRQICREYLLETTSHGCRNIQDRRRGVLYRVSWTCVVLSLLGTLLYILFESYNEFLKYEVRTKNSIEVLREMPFPAITVCSSTTINVHGKNISQTLKDYFGSTTMNGFFAPAPNWSDPASRELEQTTFKYVMDELTITEMRKFINHHVWRGSGNMNFTPVYTDSGKCYLANNNTSQRAVATVEGRAGGLELILSIQEEGVIMQGDMTYGAMIFVHDPNENARTTKDGVMVAPGNSIYIKVKPTKYKFLPAPYKSYGNSFCVETDAAYSYEACVTDWTSTQAAQHCNCTFGVEPPSVIARFSSCTLKHFAICYQPTRGKFIRESLRENFTVCPKPCSFTRYDTGVSFSKFPTASAAEKIASYSSHWGYPDADVDYVRRNVMKVTVYFDSFLMDYVMYEQQVTFESISSTVGGEMGLFLGASLVTVMEFGEFLLRLCWNLGKKMVAKTGNKTKVTSLRKS